MKKYLFYVLGEILLVVIGILIALQINNWNTQQQETKELKGFIRNISSNIKSDLEELRALKELRDSTRAFSTNFMNAVNADFISKDEFYKVWNWTYNPSRTRYFNPDQSGFEGLKNSGYLSKLQGKALEPKLYEYYNLVSEIIMEQRKLNSFIENLSQKGMEHNITQQLDKLRYHTNSYSLNFEDESKIILELLRYPAFTGINTRNRDQRMISDLYEKIIPLGEDVINICEKEIK
ncbi:MAG: hypothetical protein IPJ74_26765 [Saprospiraceae bacterium]|nr:hypothetical protein [Saprospiraceae bacterium]